MKIVPPPLLPGFYAKNYNYTIFDVPKKQQLFRFHHNSGAARPSSEVNVPNHKINRLLHWKTLNHTHTNHFSLVAILTVK